jgi:hypothetical protein
MGADGTTREGRPGHRGSQDGFRRWHGGFEPTARSTAVSSQPPVTRPSRPCNRPMGGSRSGLPAGGHERWVRSAQPGRDARATAGPRTAFAAGTAVSNQPPVARPSRPCYRPRGGYRSGLAGRRAQPSGSFGPRALGGGGRGGVPGDAARIRGRPNRAAKRAASLLAVSC